VSFLSETYNKIITLFEKFPEVLYGFTGIGFSEYKSKFKGALIFAVPHSKMLTFSSYDEEKFENLIVEARSKGNSILIEIEAILNESSCSYEIPPIAQTSEDTLIAPFSFKYAAVNAHLGLIGKSGVLITEKYGPRVRLFAVLVNLDFPVTSPIFDSKCQKGCFECVNACPYKALKGKQWNINIIRDEIIDYQLCNHKRKIYIKSHGRKHSCGFCIVACPYGL